MTAPASGLPAFNSVVHCVKCGSDNIGLRYCAQLRNYYHCGPGFDAEHMHRTCRECGYEWFERPLDMKGGLVAVTHAGVAAA